VKDYENYLKSFEMLVANSREHQCMIEFIHTVLPDILARIGAGKNTLNMMGLGSGSGEIDLEILKVMHGKHPDAKIEVEVVEPSYAMLNKYKTLSKMPGFDYATFSWNEITAEDFENKLKKENSAKKLHLINMIQMLYYVKDPKATLSFYQRLLHKSGKVLVILLSDESAWGRFLKTFHNQLYKDGFVKSVTSGDIKSFLDSKKISYQNYKLQSLLDITQCFIPGDEKGEQLLNVVTEVIDFSKNAPPELKKEVLDFLKNPENYQEVKNRILFDCSTEALVID
ncbi:histamine N-methyltransferase, partial [Silurus asotus]